MDNTQNSTRNTSKSINLIQGTFTPSEASDLLLNMIEKKISFHKIQVCSKYEGNHSDPCTHDNTRLGELELEKIRLKEIISNMRSQGKRLKISAIVNIEEVD